MGARSFLFIKGTDDMAGHAINVVNVDGTVRFLDGQTDEVFEYGPIPQSFERWLSQ